MNSPCFKKRFPALSLGGAPTAAAAGSTEHTATLLCLGAAVAAAGRSGREGEGPEKRSWSAAAAGGREPTQDAQLSATTV